MNPRKEERHDDNMTTRISKAIASSSLGVSRRQAEKIVTALRVRLNGQVVTELGTRVSENDVLTIDHKPVQPKRAGVPASLYIAHKLRGELVTTDDPEGRPTMAQRLKKKLRLRPIRFVGRLDFNTEGLVLLTDDGDLARHLELPSSALERRYRVRVHGAVTDWKLAAMRRGMSLGKEKLRLKPMQVELEREAKGTNSWLTISCTEGKNRQIRRACSSLNLTVNRLIRTGFGPFNLKQLPQGEFMKVSPGKLEVSRDARRGPARSSQPHHKGKTRK
uniref:RNA-binding S4 domain-containing protein n=2 Tax=Octactis speculum TaxID=3111310 RepID=A0A7S2H1H6_9STRA